MGWVSKVGYVVGWVGLGYGSDGLGWVSKSGPMSMSELAMR